MKVSTEAADPRAVEPQFLSPVGFLSKVQVKVTKGWEKISS